MPNISVTNSGENSVNPVPGLKTSLWSDFTPWPNQSIKISPIADHQSILMQSDEQALLRYHVRDSNFDVNGFDVTGLDSYTWKEITSTSTHIPDANYARNFDVTDTGFYAIGDYIKIYDSSDFTRWMSGTITDLIQNTTIQITTDTLAGDPEVPSSTWIMYSVTTVWSIGATERILPANYHYEMNGVMGFDGYYFVPATTATTVTMQYTNPQFDEAYTASVQALDFAAENINAYLNVPSIYSQFRTRSNGAWIQNANWSENPTYSYDWHFGNDGVLDAPGKINDNYGNIRSIPRVGKYYTDNVDHHVDATWAGRHLYFTYDGLWDAVFIPDDASLNLPIGFTFTIVTDDNEPGQWIYINANDENLTYVTAVGLDYSSIGYDLSGNTLVTVMKIDSNRWIISGSGVFRD
jgi:hypothetical protein